ncbi:MAG: transcriptional regulator [Clostridia bacterium]|nr:transcriptional regulator [Clostridia bacterium]
MGDKVDFKKRDKYLYLPGTRPERVVVPPLPFIMIPGQGDPNQPDGAYQKALSLLYSLTFTIKMSKLAQAAPAGYYEYTVPPLEGLWWMADNTPGFKAGRKSGLAWIAMIRQPDFVDGEVFAWAAAEVRRKKGLESDAAHLRTFEEGLCVQCMHLGPYDEEPATIAKIESYLATRGFISDIGPERRHHEIYLNDPNRIAPEKLKTVLRIPVKEV